MDCNSFRNLIEAYSEVYTQVDENLLGSLDKTARETAGKVGGVLGREKAGKMPGANVPILGDVIKNEGERRGRAQGQGMYDKAKETLGGLLKQNYDLEGDLVDEAAKRMPKKVRGDKDPKKEMAGRSDAGKRISGDENTGPNYYTKGRSRGAEVDAPTQPGQKPKGTPKLASWEKDDIQYRKANLKAGKVHKVGGEKGLPESYDLFDYLLEYLVAEGYAETNKAAIAIMANMSEEWRESIVEEVLDEGHGSRTSFKKQSADERWRVKAFGSNYTPHKNYDPEANRGQGQILRPNQAEKQRRKKLRNPDGEN